MRTLLGSVALLLTSLSPLPALACSCLEQPFDVAHQQAVAIFEGRAASITTADDGRLLVTFDVTQTWRAAEHEHVEVLTASNGAACGYTFEIGTSYLVYASDTEGERYIVSLCSRTARMADADGDRVSLGSGVVPVDVVDSPATDPSPTQPPPTRAGCASCTVSGPTDARAGALVLLALMLVRRLRRSRS